jgi:hypothetical protein
VNRIRVLIALVSIAGCATTGGEKWQRSDPSQPIDEEQMQQDKLNCLNQAGPSSPGAAAPLSSTRNQMIDCMRIKGWVRR